MTRDLSARWAYGAALLLALVPVLLWFPPAFLAGQGLFFQDGDASKDVTGWLFYAQDRWHWPWLYTTRLNYPQGISVAFTDSVPLMALLWRPWVAWLPAGFHYFGLWVAACALLQALGAVFLVRGLGARNVWGLLAAVVFALSAPIFLLRFGHMALLGQGVLLVQLGLYVRLQAQPRQAGVSGALVWAAVALPMVTLLIHPYLMAMTQALLLAALVDRARATGAWAAAGVRLAVALLGTALLAWVMGYVAPGSSLGTGDYGKYALDVMGLVCGSEQAALSGCAGPGGESQVYLGLGVWLLLPLALWLGGAQLGAWARRHVALLAVLGGMALFALSHRLVVDGVLLGVLPLPEAWLALASVFQASARFVWPTIYLVMFAAVAMVARQTRPVYWLWLALAAVVQVVDVAPARQALLSVVRQPAPVQDARWATVLEDAQHLVMQPTFHCGFAETFLFLPLSRLAADHGVTFNTVYAARQGLDCAARAAELAAAPLAPDTQYVVPADLPREVVSPAVRSLLEAGRCTRLPLTASVWATPRHYEVDVCPGLTQEPS